MKSRCCRVPLAFELFSGMLVFRTVGKQRRYRCRCTACGRESYTLRQPTPEPPYKSAR
jgi:hypothetical protein